MAGQGSGVMDPREHRAASDTQRKTRSRPEPRPPPAFQVYASDDLASERYYSLSLAQRGLLDAIRRGCWVSPDGSVPSEPEQLSIVIRRPESEVKAVLNAGVLAWLVKSTDGRLRDRDLDRQKQACILKRQAQREGAIQTNRKRWPSSECASVTDPDNDSPSKSVLNRNETTRGDLQEMPDAMFHEEDEWVRGYQKAEPQFPTDSRTSTRARET